MPSYLSGKPDVALDLVEEYLTVRYFPYNDSQKAKEMADGQARAARKYIARALMAVINERRWAAYSYLADEGEMIPAITPIEAEDFLTRTHREWLLITPVSTRPKIDEWGDLQVELAGLLQGEEIQEIELRRHKRAVKEGREEPTAADAKWIAEERAELETEARSLRDAADAAERLLTRLTVPDDTPSVTEQRDILVRFIHENQPLVDGGSLTAKGEVEGAIRDLNKLGFDSVGQPLTRTVEDELDNSFM